MSELISQYHVNGVHLECDSDCAKAGTVERFHSHDYDGIIICCKED